ncbi:MAG TPA: aminotransferase class I/II-fold pyridoxal phosphate-dependent enzyme [Candidatus Aminicenantes bacterium]|nr:aminotransferase class I/II-fold pyridoxal phosphate-dependent enzyme [Candidatus Aminicenantes bacterium]HRY65734.1 aminotransferase class I/II-fold pyridoxal phosphate-dependent enzyme [Candidatus Aminicenantes bacterium]HRZ72648.1 aminotransferase class I/II-fold pyridoxal phosphate-dependent enzyme [Candidatus Aminicenantes bacterium]
MDKKRIYLSPPHLDGAERELLLQAFDSNWITTLGPQVNEFEREICARTGVGYAAALSSGTAALHLALLMLGVGPGDEVVCSDLTFSASANAIAYLGAAPVFVDSERKSWNIDPELLAEELGEKARKGRLPKAAVIVDLYGQCADHDRIGETCRSFGVPVVEDAAEALGATYRGRPAGRFGVMGVYSFNGNKIITTSGGGMLVSDDEGLVRRAKFLATQARDPAPHYQHSEIGYNYRLSNLLAALGRGQLARLDAKVARRKEINGIYRRAFADLPGLEFLPAADFGAPNYWLTVVLITPALFGADREAVRLALEAANIEARPVWKPMHMQPVFRSCPRRGGAVSEDLFARGLCLPSGGGMSGEDIERIAAIIRGCCQGR